MRITRSPTFRSGIATMPVYERHACRSCASRKSTRVQKHFVGFHIFVPSPSFRPGSATGGSFFSAFILAYCSTPTAVQRSRSRQHQKTEHTLCTPLGSVFRRARLSGKKKKKATTYIGVERVKKQKKSARRKPRLR